MPIEFPQPVNPEPSNFAHKRSYAILGTGALGGFYGARLQQAGLEVHFLLNRDYEQVQQHGLVIESPEGNFVLPQVFAYQKVEQMPACDVVAIALKTTQNHLLTDLLPAVVKPGGIVLVLQNGLGIEAEVAEIVKDQVVLGGLCFLCSNKPAPGYIHHVDYGSILLGEYRPHYQPAGITENLRQVASDFNRAGIEIQLTDSLLLGRWRKLVWNIPYNGLSVVLNATTHELMSDEHGRFLIGKLMQEVVLGANACLQQLPTELQTIPNSFIQHMLDYTLKMKPYRTSMKIDYDEGRPLEVEAMFGNPLRAAQAAGVTLPKIAMLYQQLKFLDTRIRASVSG